MVVQHVTALLLEQNRRFWTCVTKILAAVTSGMVYSMLLHFVKFLHVVQLLVFFMVFLKFIKLAALFDLLSHSVNTYNYNLASFLVTFLKPISTNQFTIKDSFTFVDWAKSHKHNNETMCSFDVCSLFTNVPLDETIQICLTKLYSLPDPPTLPRTVLKDLLEFATKKSHFIFDGQYYDQVDGV